MWRSQRVTCALYYALLLGAFTLIALMARVFSLPQPWLDVVYACLLILFIPVVLYSAIMHVIVPLRGSIRALWQLRSQPGRLSLVILMLLFWVGIVIGFAVAGQVGIAIALTFVSLLVLDRAYAGSIPWLTKHSDRI